MYKIENSKNGELINNIIIPILSILLVLTSILIITPRSSSSLSSPVADAGKDQIVRVGEVVQFNGSGSYDPFDEILSESQPETNYTDPSGGTHTGWWNAEVNTSQGVLYDNSGELVRIDLSFYVSDGSSSGATYEVVLSFKDNFNNSLGTVSRLANRSWEWYTFRFSTPIPIEAGGLYYISIKAPNGNAYPMWNGIGITGYDPYPKAHGYFQGKIKDDFTFKTYLSGPPTGQLDFEWDFDSNVDSDNDGNFTNDVDATGTTPSHSYLEEGIYMVTLTVVDIQGLSDSDICIITVVSSSILPPILYITTRQNGIVHVLYWDPPPIPGIDYYLIYRSSSQTDFDFNNVWINTSFNLEPGEVNPKPLRTMWNDTESVFPGVDDHEEKYYVIRAVNIFGEISRTSRTVGKWTKTFPPGISTFSLPLEPFDSFSTAQFTSLSNADYLKYIDSETHNWQIYYFGDEEANNIQLKLGEGYEVKFQNQTSFTFTGLPAAMVMYDDDVGFLGFEVKSEGKSLEAYIGVNGDVTLSWQEPGNMGIGDWYDVYYSNSRDGFFGTLETDYFLVNNKIDFGISTTTHVDAQATNPGSRLYYMVVPFNTSGVRGSSTYSIGIWTEDYHPGYDSFGIPLKIDSYHTADWYCDNIHDTVGINYYDTNTQCWNWHSTNMPQGAFDPQLEMVVGYQISTKCATKFTFIGK